MAISLTSFPPRHRGELAVYQQLTLQKDDALYLWASLDFIPGVNDIDLFMWHEEIGCRAVADCAGGLRKARFEFSTSIDWAA